MFGIKKKEKSEGELLDAHIDTIPEIFYGGQDPLVYRTPQRAEAPLVQKTPQSPIGQAPTQKLPQSPIVPPPSHSASLFSKKWLWISVSAVFIIAIGGIAWYYIRQARPAKRTVPPGQINLTTRTAPLPAPTPTPPPPPPPVETTPTTTPPTPGGAIDFPRLALVDSSDLDADELTDVEEELFGTDTGIWDSDGDSYYDGQEVFNLYNPKGTAPIKIIDSGLIREYRNPSIGYRLYYPKSWQLDAVNEDNTQVLITSITGDFIEIRAMPRQSGEEFERWFAVNAPRQKITDLETLVNRFGSDMRVRKDKLVAFIETPTHILVVVYHPRDSGPITLRHVMQMIIQSFRSNASSSTPLSPVSTSTP